MSSTRTEQRLFISLFLFLILFFGVSDAFASKNEDMEHYQGKLEKLQKSIAKIQQHLKGTKRQRSSVLTELKNLESEISKNSRKLKKIEDDIYKVKGQKRNLEGELAQLNRQLSEQRAILSEQVRSAYSMGHQQNLKMLLNQQDPAQAGRAHVYFNYLNRAREQQIELFLETFQQKKQTEAELKQTITAQNALLKEQKEKKRQRQKQRFQRKQLLAELSKKIKNQE